MQQTIKAWRNVYLIAGMISFFFAVVWTIFGTANTQSWDTYWETSEQKKEIAQDERTIDQSQTYKITSLI